MSSEAFHVVNYPFLPNGADTDVLKPLPLDAAYAVKLGVAGKKVFTYAGTHAYYHGLEVLIDTAELLRIATTLCCCWWGRDQYGRS